MKKIAINGFGRIGRLAFRSFYNRKDVEVVAINDLTSPKTLAYLLEHDSAQGLFCKGKISYTDKAIIVEGKEILIFSEKSPENLPWGKLGVDLVIESTGFFKTKEDISAHIKAGAKKAIISAPASGEMKTIVYGVNHKTLTASDIIISGASCTTNCLSPVAYILEKEFGIEKGLMTTIHAVTNDQRLLDLPHSDLRRGRSGMVNIIPTTTGAAVAVSKVLPSLKGKLDGIAMRVPTVTGSVVDLVVELKKDTTVEEINRIVKKYADSELSQTLEYTNVEIVSTDIIGSTHGSIFDATLTSVLEVNGKKLFKLIMWYDNESSYVSQLVRTTLHFLQV